MVFFTITMNDFIYQKKYVPVRDALRSALESTPWINSVEKEVWKIRFVFRAADENITAYATQKFLKKYRRLIKKLSPLTGIQVIKIKYGQMFSYDTAHWETILPFIEMMIYARALRRHGQKQVVEDALKAIDISDA